MTKATKAIKKTVKTVIPLIFLMKWASFLVEVLATKDLTYKQEGHKTMVAEFEIDSWIFLQLRQELQGGVCGNCRLFASDC